MIAGHRATASRGSITVKRFEHALITGAAGAIGAALARAFAAEGARLTLWDIDRERLDRVADELDADRHRVDLTDLSALPEHFAAAAAGQPVDVLVNCAGFMDVRRVETQPWPVAQRIIDLDLTAPIRLMQLAGEPMLARRRGLVVNICSVAALFPVKGCALYGAAKAGLAMASEITHAEWRARGVEVLTVYPGPITSPLEAGARAGWGDTPWQRALRSASPESLADAIVDAARAGRTRLIHPRSMRWLAPPVGLIRRFTARMGPPPAR